MTTNTSIDVRGGLEAVDWGRAEVAVCVRSLNEISVEESIELPLAQVNGPGYQE